MWRTIDEHFTKICDENITKICDMDQWFKCHRNFVLKIGHKNLWHESMMNICDLNLAKTFVIKMSKKFVTGLSDENLSQTFVTDIFRNKNLW